MYNRFDLSILIGIFIILKFEFNSGKYLLISLDSGAPNTNVSKGNFAQSRTITLDKEIALPNEARQRCQSQELKNQGSFIISKTVEKFGRKVIAIKYVAYLNEEKKEEEEEMGYARSAMKGDCNEVDVEEEYRGCRLGTFLMQACLEDDQVGSYDAKNLPQKRDSAQRLCKNIKVLACNPDTDEVTGTRPWNACSAYLTAAKAAGYEMVFISNECGDEESEGDPKTFMFQVETAKLHFKAKGAEPFIKHYGKYWAFCKCKPDQMEDCLNPKVQFYFRTCV